MLQTLEVSEVDEMHTYIQQNRHVLQVQDDQSLMIGIAWVTAMEK